MNNQLVLSMELTVYIKESKMYSLLSNHVPSRYVPFIYYDIQNYPIIIEYDGSGSNSEPFVIVNSLFFKKIEFPLNSFKIINQSNIIFINTKMDSMDISDSSNITLENYFFNDECIYSRSTNIFCRIPILEKN